MGRGDPRSTAGVGARTIDSSDVQLLVWALVTSLSCCHRFLEA